MKWKISAQHPGSSQIPSMLCHLLSRYLICSFGERHSENPSELRCLKNKIEHHNFVPEFQFLFNINFILPTSDLPCQGTLWTQSKHLLLFAQMRLKGLLPRSLSRVWTAWIFLFEDVMQEWISSEYPIFQPEATETRYFPSDLCRSASVDHKSNPKQFGLASTDLATHHLLDRTSREDERFGIWNLQRSSTGWLSYALLQGLSEFHFPRVRDVLLPGHVVPSHGTAFSRWSTLEKLTPKPQSYCFDSLFPHPHPLTCAINLLLLVVINRQYTTYYKCRKCSKEVALLMSKCNGL